MLESVDIHANHKEPSEVTVSAGVELILNDDDIAKKIDSGTGASFNYTTPSVKLCAGLPQ